MSQTHQADVHVRAVVVDRSWRDSERNLQDMIFTTVRRALDESGLAFADVDSVVAAAHDLVDGRSLSSMVSSPAAGSYLRHEVRFSDDSAAAFAIAAMRVSAGESRNCVVAAWGRASEGEPDKIANRLFDPFFSQPLGLTELAVSALRASGALRRFPGYAAHREAATARRTRVALTLGERSPCPAPLRTAELPCWADFVVATVLTSDPTDVRVAGVGLSSEPYWLGDRNLLRVEALTRASTVALAASGYEPDELCAVELDGLTLFDEALAVEAVRLAPEGKGMAVLADDVRVNRSGGYASGYCAPAMGLVRIADVAEALRSRVTSGQGRAVGLATGSSTVAGQTHAAVVLESVT